jgi:hypothetical protein
LSNPRILASLHRPPSRVLADLILRTALWMREAPPEQKMCWRELAIVAKALADGRDLTEIGLMRDIAQRTVWLSAGLSR